jgi:hypothetical protein
MVGRWLACTDEIACYDSITRSFVRTSRYVIQRVFISYLEGLVVVVVEKEVVDHESNLAGDSHEWGLLVSHVEKVEALHLKSGKYICCKFGEDLLVIDIVYRRKGRRRVCWQ